MRVFFKEACMLNHVYISEESEQAIHRITGINGYSQSLNCVYICCMSMLIERMLDLSFPPDMCAQFALRCGVTEENGLPMLSAAVAGRFSLRHTECEQENALAQIAAGAKGIVRMTFPAEEKQRYYLIDQVKKTGIYMINPSLQQAKGIPRSKKRLIQIKDGYMIVPKDVYVTLCPENAQYFVFSQ